MPKVYGCYNHPPMLDHVEIQDGWTEDGRRRLVTVPFVMSRDCGYDLQHTDPQCQHCCHQHQGTQ